MPLWWGRLRDTVKRYSEPEFESDWLWVDFLFGPTPPRLHKRYRFEDGISKLDGSVLPGFNGVGHFGSFRFSPERDIRPGRATIIVAESKTTRDYPDFPFFEVALFPTGDNPKSIDELWSDVGARLPNLYTEALFARLRTRFGVETACQSAVGHLLALKGKARLDAAERAMVAFLEEAPIFSYLGYKVGGPYRLTLAELRKAKVVCPVDFFLGCRINARKCLEGVVFIEEGGLAAELQHRYRLPWNQKLADQAVALVSADYLTPEEKGRALHVSFGLAARTERGWEFPVSGHSKLIFDARAGTLRGPVSGSPGEVEISIRELCRVDVDEDEIRGDTKIHQIFSLAISDGTRSLFFKERYKDYYEGGSVQKQLDEYQVRAKAVLHALVEALQFPERRLAREDLGGRSLDELV